MGILPELGSMHSGSVRTTTLFCQTRSLTRVEALTKMKDVPRDVERWLHQHNLHGMLRVHQAIPFDDLSEALVCREVSIIPEWIRATLDVANTGSIAEEVPDTGTLTEFFGFRTLEVPNDLFGDLVYFLSEDAFVVPSPHIMHPSRAGFIITAWQGTVIDWGEIMVGSLVKEIRAYQTHKSPAWTLLYWMGLLFCPEDSRVGTVPSVPPSVMSSRSLPNPPQAKATLAPPLHHRPRIRLASSVYVLQF